MVPKEPLIFLGFPGLVRLFVRSPVRLQSNPGNHGNMDSGVFIFLVDTARSNSPHFFQGVVSWLYPR